MRDVLRICLFAIASCMATLQSKAEGDKFVWGLKASVDAELPGKWRGDNVSFKMYKHGVGFTIGGISNITLGRNFYLEPGVSLFYSQYRYDDFVFSMEDGLSIWEPDPKLYKWGVQVPLMFGYSIECTESFYVDVYTGPQIRYAFAGGISLKDKSFIEGMEDDFDLWGINGQRRFDCSWKIGIGIPVNAFSLFVEADLGMTDLMKSDGIKFRENRFGGGLTYNF